MDFKLPNRQTSAACRDYFFEHKKFLELAKQKDVFVKVVITLHSSLKDVLRAAQIVKEVAPNISFILQPQHPLEYQLEDKMLYFFDKVGQYLDQVKIIPQMHKLAGIK